MQAATFGIENGRSQDAVSHLEQLRRLDPSDPRILVKLVSAYSQFSPSQAEEVSVKLLLPEQAVNMDADALEQMPIYRHRVAKATATTEQKVQATQNYKLVQPFNPHLQTQGTEQKVQATPPQELRPSCEV